MSRVRVLVVDDSATQRHYLVDVLSVDPEIEVVGHAADGEAAYHQCCALRPDVITLDMEMPGVSGLDATERIMADCPTAILIVSASDNRRDAFNTFDALAAGAMDVHDKPRGDDGDDEWGERLRAKVKRMARVRPISHPRARLANARRPRAIAPAATGTATPAGSGALSYRLLAIGASTGGPGAVSQILRQLDGSFPLPILLVIHIGRLFGSPLAEWLDSLSPLRVRQAVDGEPLPSPGQARVLLAAPERHLVVDGARVRFDDGPERHHCRPSVDVLFESVAREYGAAAIGCLLTGMGTDGAAGLLAMHRAGALTVAQDEATSIVYGMPRAAAALGAAQEILPLPDIAARLVLAAALPRTP